MVIAGCTLYCSQAVVCQVGAGSQGESDILESRAEAAPAQRNPSWNFVIAATPGPGCNLQPVMGADLDTQAAHR